MKWGFTLAVIIITSCFAEVPDSRAETASCKCNSKLTVSKSAIPCEACCSSALGLGQMIIAYTDCSDNKLPSHYSNYLHKYNIGGVEPRGCRNSPDLKKFDPPLIIASNGYGKHGDEPQLTAKNPDGGSKTVTIDQGSVLTNPFDVTSRENYDFLLDEGCHRLMGFASCHFARESGFNTLFGPSVEMNPAWAARHVDDWFKMDWANISGHRAAGCQNTIKHYPFVNNAFAMHHVLVEDDRSLADIEKSEAGFASAIAGEKPAFIMTTHIMNKNVDDQYPPTFSPKWVGRLKKMSESNPPGPLIMTDGMFMVNNYPLKDYFPTLLGDLDSESEGMLTTADIKRLESCPQDRPINRYWLNKLAFPDPAASKKKGGERPLYETFGKYLSKDKLSDADYLAISMKMGLNDGSMPVDDGSKSLVDQFHCLSRTFAKDAALRKRLKTTNDKFMGVVTQRAIMAGHDLAIMEGSSADGARSMDYMIANACSNSKAGEAFRARIAESSKRVADHKASPDFTKGLNPPATDELPGEVSQAIVAVVEKMNSFLRSPEYGKLTALIRENAECRSLLPPEFNCMTSYPNAMQFLDSK